MMEPDIPLRKYVNSVGQGILDALEGVSYLIDLEERIVAFGRPTWNEFVDDNGGADALHEENVIGRRLTDFISGADVRASYVSFMNRLKAAPDKKIVIPFRCDAPSERREHRITISAVRSETQVIGYLYVSTLLVAQIRPPINLFDFQSMTSRIEEQRSLPIVKICSYCQRIHQDNAEEWVEAIEYYRRGGTDAVRLSHGICGDCKANIVDPQI